MAYDEKLQFYTTVAEEISSQVMSCEVGFAVLHMEPLARALRENARGWVTSLGKQLNDSARESLNRLREELEVGGGRLFEEQCMDDLKSSIQLYHIRSY